ncbi:MAG: hypothetical protein AAB309_07020 [Deltaproteobacteria bacterium]
MSNRSWIGFFLAVAISSSLHAEEIDYSVATVSLRLVSSATKSRFEKMILRSEVEKASSQGDSIQKAFSRMALAALLDFKAEEFLFYPHVPKYRVDYALDLIFMNQQDPLSDRVKIYESMKKQKPWHFQITWKEKLPEYLIDPALHDQEWEEVELSWISLPPTLPAFEESVRQKLDRIYHSMVRRKVTARIINEKWDLSSLQPALLFQYYEKNWQHFPKELFRSQVLDITADEADVDRIVEIFEEREAYHWKKLGEKFEPSDTTDLNLVQELRRSFSADFLDQLKGLPDKKSPPLIQEHEIDFTSQSSKQDLYLFSLSEGTDTTFIPFTEFRDDEGKYHLWILKEKGVPFVDSAVQRFIRNQLAAFKRRDLLIKWIQEALRDTVLRFSDRVLKDSADPLSSFQISDVENQILPALAVELEKIFEIEFICI